jgi:Ca2+-binding RTX toxin-like protein
MRIRLLPLLACGVAAFSPPGAHAALGNITMQFAAGTLTLTSPADPISLSCIGGNVAVNGEVPVEVPAVSCAAVLQIVVTGGGGDNTVDLAPLTAATYPALTQVSVDGGDGNDTITGGDGADILRGGPGNDTIDGNNNPAATVDSMFGDAGDDTLIWNPGKNDDLNEGGDGNDTSVINGGGGAEVFAVSAVAGRVRFERSTNNGTPNPFFVDIGTTERLVVNANAGDDTLAGGAGLAALIALEVNGGDGNDTITGGDGADILRGGPGNDTIDGNDNPVATVDAMFGDEGDDTLVWSPGKDDDRNDGGDGNDLSLVNGGGGAEVFSIAPNGARVLLQRTTNNGAPAPFFVDIGSTERLRVNGNAGDDSIVASVGLAALIALELDGGDGADSITGGDGADLLRGGAGNDTLQPGENPVASVDQAFGGAGDDLFLWNPGEDDDAIEGEDGFDTTLVNAAGANESFHVFADGARTVVERLLPSRFVVDSAGIEALQLNTAGGDDLVETELLFDVEQRLDGGAAATAQGDRVTVLGFDGDARFSPILTPHFGAVSHVGFESQEGIRSGGSFTAALAGAQEVPPVNSDGNGRGLVVLSPQENEIRVTLDFVALQGNSTLAHLHGPAAAGSNAAPIFDLTGSGGNAGNLGPFRFAVTPQQVQELRSSLWYFNVHSTVAANGEIRGQALPDLVLRAPLEARQVFPASVSTARGYGSATLAGTMDEVRTTLAFAGLVGEADPGSNSANLVRGPALRLQTGAPVAAVTLPASNLSEGAFVSGPFALSTQQAEQVRDGRWYFEVQSVEFPQGELRGQITQSLFFDNFE